MVDSIRNAGAMPEDHSWYHFSSGSILGDVALFGGGETLARAYSGQLARGGWADKLTRWASPLGKGSVGPGYLLTREGAGFKASQIAKYYENKKFNQFKFMGDAARGRGAFQGATGRTGYQRLSSMVGGKVANRITAGAMLSLGVRTAFTALNFGLGMSLGRGVGDMIANYETDRTSEDITLESGGFYADTRTSFTQRQRSIRLIHNSQLTTRAALGNEASFMHI